MKVHDAKQNKKCQVLGRTMLTGVRKSDNHLKLFSLSRNNMLFMQRKHEVEVTDILTNCSNNSLGTLRIFES